MLEHMVDCVLNFEGDRYQSFRILRAAKNRYGSTSELGIFTMEAGGLVEVENPSALFLSERPAGAPGSAVVPVMEGSRPLLVEVQGLVSPSYSGGIPRRTATGLDLNRVSLLIAVLEKRVGLPLYNCDIFINVVGGVKIMEPAVDLAVALGLVSSYRDRPLKGETMLVGEVGLTGEVRPVGRLQERLREGIKMGFTSCLLPRGNLRTLNTAEEQYNTRELEIVPISSLAEAIDLALV
ncbi:MAG: S16 family serine protease [Bacillota bacterium]